MKHVSEITGVSAHRVGPRNLALALTGAAGLFLAACGGSDPGLSEAAPSPPPTGPGVNMVLEAHLSVGDLVQNVHTSHDEPDAAPGALAGSGNWGYTTPDGRRLALTGVSVGLSIVDVTTPSAPLDLGLIPGADSPWREVKTFGHYAYVTTEAKAGLDIVDLGNPDAPRKVRTWTSTFLSAHSLWIDQERRLLFAHGAGDANGRTGTHILSLDDPENPREIGRFTDFYIHDAFTRGHVLFASAIQGGFQSFIDVSDPRRPREMSRFFTGGRVTHNSSLTADGRYLFTTDETPNAPLQGWDITDPVTPQNISQFISGTNTIAHNVLVDGTRLLVSHYTEGVFLLDISNPRAPTVLGSYDTLEATMAGFHGAWGAYIFPGTNLIVVSDIDGGLFVLRYTP